MHREYCEKMQQGDLREFMDSDRELVTFCYIYAQGGCEPQLTGHTAGNFRMGNDKSVMTQVVLHCIPFIGYPRTLNALAVINKVAEEQEGK